MGSKLTKNDIIPHIFNPGYKAYFARFEMNKRAIASGGLNPLNRTCLLDPDIFVSKPKDFPRYSWMDDANEEVKEAVPELPPIPPLHIPTPPTPRDASILVLNTTSRMAGTVFNILFQNVIRQEDRDERGGHMKDGDKRHKSLE